MMRFITNDFDLTPDAADCVLRCNNFAEIRLDWYMLPAEIREELVRECLDDECGDRWFYLSIVIPKTEKGFDIRNTYFYIDELPPDEEMYTGIGAALADSGGEWLHKFDIPAAGIVSLLSGTLPEINMKT